MSFCSDYIVGSADPEELKPNTRNLMYFMFAMILSGATQGYTDYSN